MSQSEETGRYHERELWKAKSKAVEERHLEVNILCARCVHGHLYRRRSALEFTVSCQRLGHNVPNDIVECSEFNAKGALDLEDMQKIALKIDPREGINEKAYR